MKNQFLKIKKSLSPDLGPSGRGRVAGWVAPPGQGRDAGSRSCAGWLRRHGGWSRGSVEAALWSWRPCVWRPWWAPAVEAAMEDGAATVDPKEKGAAAAMEDGGAAAAVEKGAPAVDLKKGAATVVKEGGGRTLTSSHPTSSLLASSCCRW
jgi:hypothetical protein